MITLERISRTQITRKNGTYIPRSLGSCVNPSTVRPWHDDRTVIVGRGKTAYTAIVCRRCGLADPRF